MRLLGFEGLSFRIQGLLDLGFWLQGSLQCCKQEIEVPILVHVKYRTKYSVSFPVATRRVRIASVQNPRSSTSHPMNSLFPQTPSRDFRPDKALTGQNPSKCTLLRCLLAWSTWVIYPGPRGTTVRPVRGRQTLGGCPFARVFRASDQRWERGLRKPQPSIQAQQMLQSFFTVLLAVPESLSADDESATIQLDEETLQKAGLLQLRFGIQPGSCLKQLENSAEGAWALKASGMLRFANPKPRPKYPEMFNPPCLRSTLNPQS